METIDQHEELLVMLALDSDSWAIDRTMHDDPRTSCAVDVSQRCAGIPTRPTQSW
jgi:hypothetical protein